MISKCLPVFLLLAGLARVSAADVTAPKPCDRVRLLATPKHEADLAGGRITGSIVSPKEGFEVLAEIKTTPQPGQWLDLKIEHPKACRWLRYEAPAGSMGWISKLEFYIGEEKREGQLISSFPAHKWRFVVDGSKPDKGTSGEEAGDHYVGLDINDKATCPRPSMSPVQGDFTDPIKVTLRSKDTEAVIRYTLDGTAPTTGNGLTYSEPIALDRSCLLTTAAIHPGLAPSPLNDGFYLFNAAPKRVMLNIGNSLSGNATGRLATFFKSGGFVTECRPMLMGGGITRTLWNSTMVEKADPKDAEKWASLYRRDKSMGGVATYNETDVDRAAKTWKEIWPPKGDIQDLTFQPRDADVAEEVDYQIRWLKVIREKLPQIQPWIYVEWVESDRQRATDKGLVPSYQMKTLYPALTWEESMSAMMLYGEEVQHELAARYNEGKRAKIIPVALAFGWIRNQIEHGKFPGVAANEYPSLMHADRVHASSEGCYLIDLVWFAAMYGQSPEGKILPWHLDLSPVQAQRMQRLAWDVVKNYPDCGLFEEGKTQVGKPEFSASGKLVTLSSSTSEAWFRYTLDGTEPTRTRGYIYCGAITAQPKMTIKAVAYKSGMADSAVVSSPY